MEFKNGFKLKDSIYDILKWIAIIVLPALSVLYVEKNGLKIIAATTFNTALNMFLKMFR